MTLNRDSWFESNNGLSLCKSQKLAALIEQS